MQSFVHRKIVTSFSYGAGATGQAGVANVKLTGLRTSAHITNASGDGSKAELSLQVYGMPLSLMNKLSVIGMQSAIYQRKNTVLVEAGDDVNGMNVVFQGNVNRAWPDMQNQPQVPFRVEATGGSFDAVKPGQPISYQGPTKASVILQNVAGQMGRSLEMSTKVANLMLTDPYFFGSPYKMMEEIGKALRIGWTDENEQTLAAWPMMGGRDGGDVILISKDTGMVNDPVATPSGILVKKLYDRPIKMAQKVEVKSIIDQANGSWQITKIDYSLESETPHGEWFVTLEAFKGSGG